MAATSKRCAPAAHCTRSAALQIVLNRKQACEAVEDEPGVGVAVSAVALAAAVAPRRTCRAGHPNATCECVVPAHSRLAAWSGICVLELPSASEFSCAHYHSWN